MNLRVIRIISVMVLTAGCLSRVFPYEGSTGINGAAWLSYGRVQAISDTSTNKFQNNWLVQPGILASISHSFNERMMGVIGFGTVLFYPGVQTLPGVSLIYKTPVAFVSHFFLTYSVGNFANPFLDLKLGYYPNNWNVYRSNFGNYLFTGPVYPAILYGRGGGDDFAEGRAMAFDAQLSLLDEGSFKQHLTVTSETDLPPLFDFSIIYRASISIKKILEIGAGVNFYRLFPFNKELTTPGKSDATGKAKAFTLEEARNQWYQGQSVNIVLGTDSIGVDTAGNAIPDTVAYLTHRGIKVGGRLMFDIKRFFYADVFGDNDLMLYGEAAIIGVKDYPLFYENIAERIPLTAGFCFPTFKLLDRLSVELEYFKSPYRHDYYFIREKLDPCPTNLDQYYVSTPGGGSDTTFAPHEDDLKWSVDIEKMFGKPKTFLIALRIASDHLRVQTDPWAPARYDLLTKPTDWYWQLKLMYMF
ncbi:MAG: hypothetical protein GF418_10940 [Chitinivibrionales bacterium]|nr:hypothetical protein [Chitinivibrionales bacterium]MBD3396131.1 hypothetical protein [Chitinivibrionales bacterium]